MYEDKDLDNLCKQYLECKTVLGRTELRIKIKNRRAYLEKEITNVFKLEISGFRSPAEVKAFVKWYEHQGEQNASLWFEELQNRGEIDRDFMPVDCSATYPIKFEGNTGFMVIK